MAYVVEYSEPIYRNTTTRQIFAVLLPVIEQAARIEIITAIREPQRKLVTLLMNRSHDLKETERVLKELNIHSEDWGAF